MHLVACIAEEASKGMMDLGPISLRGNSFELRTKVPRILGVQRRAGFEMNQIAREDR